MLVLSRKVNELIKFPELGISIEILNANRSKVQLGIDAPIEIKVIRGELSQPTISKEIQVSSADDHFVRNVLHNLTVATGVTRKLIQLGKMGRAASILNQALDGIEKIREQNSFGSIDVRSPAPKATALLVEDVENERELLAGFLRLHGYETTTVKDGMECLDYLEENDPPDFILMDMNLPRLNGADTIARLRDADNDIEIFAVSGLTPQSFGVDVAKSQISHWFQKPLDPTHLVQKLDRQFQFQVSELEDCCVSGKAMV